MESPKKSVTDDLQNSVAVLPPRITTSRSRGYVAPSRRKSAPNDGEEEERLSNHKTKRYWNSYEEMYLVELWGRYKNELTDFTKPLPVHRKIMNAMRSKNMIVNGQDCRRKINVLKNKYLREVQRIGANNVKSNWRLFPLIRCVMDPTNKESDNWHESKVVRKLLEEMPKPPELELTVAETPSVTTTVKKYQKPSTLAASSPAPTNNKIPSYTSDNSSHASSPVIKKPLQSHTFSQTAGEKSNFPFRDITMKKYEQIKLRNEILAEERKISLKRLRLEEEGFKILEAILIDLNESTLEVLRSVEMMKESSLQKDNADVLSNEENINNEGEQTSSDNTVPVICE